MHKAHKLAVLLIPLFSQEGSNAILEDTYLNASHAVNRVSQRHKGVSLLRTRLNSYPAIDACMGQYLFHKV